MNFLELHTTTKAEYIDLMFTEGQSNRARKAMLTREIKATEELLTDVEAQIARQGNPMYFMRFGESISSVRAVRALKAELTMLKELRIELNNI